MFYYIRMINNHERFGESLCPFKEGYFYICECIYANLVTKKDLYFERYKKTVNRKRFVGITGLFAPVI